MKDFHRILSYLRPYRFHLLGAFLSLILVTLTQLAVPRYAGSMIDEIIRTRSYSALDRAALAVLGLLAFRSIFVYAQVYLTYYLGHRTIADIRRDLFARIQRWSLDRFASWQSGDAISRIMQDTNLLQTNLLAGAVDIMATALLLAGIVVMLFWLQWQLALLVGIVIPVVFAITRLFGKEIHHVAIRAQEHVGSLASVISEAFAGALVIRAFTQEDRQVARFTNENERATQANLRIGRLVATQVPVVSFLTAVGLVFVLWVGGRLVAGGRMTPGSLVAFLAYMAMAIEPAVALTRHHAEVRQALGAFTRIRRVLEEPSAVADLPGAVELTGVHGQVEFRDVSFKYLNGMSARGTDEVGPAEFPAEQQWVLRGIDLAVAPGENVALVGPSGAGKTSLVYLLARFYDPLEGTVLLDGTDVRRLRVRSLRRQIGFVPQETVLFTGTVRDNIAFARPDATKSDVEAAARAANAHEFIEALPRGYDTVIGEDGSTLSGGQRQRLAVARALLLDPKILILDEATSALDSESEALIQEALERAMKGRTTITIAHRLSTVRKADRIIVLDEGRLVEQGTHDELLSQDGLYAHFARLQWPDVMELSLGPARTH